jgi:hypothetical protein
MDFVDATLLRLADESARSTVFDNDSLSQILSASHDLSGAGVEEPFDLVFDDISFVHDDESSVGIDGSWMTMGHTERTELTLRAAGLGRSMPRIDLLIAGAVVATARGGGGRITAVDMNWLELAGIDSEITPLPDDPAVLEQRRRERLLARVRARMSQPLVFDDNALGQWLTRLGVGSVTELMSAPVAAAGATLTITLGEGPEESVRRRRFPVAAALLIRDVPLSLAALLDETRRIRPYLHRLGFAAADDSQRRRQAPIVAWVVPGALFEDAAWPGAAPGSTGEQRAERRRWAGAWLARERIGLIVPPQ